MTRGAWNKAAFRTLREVLRTKNPARTVVHAHVWTKAPWMALFWPHAMRALHCQPSRPPRATYQLSLAAARETSISSNVASIACAGCPPGDVAALAETDRRLGDRRDRRICDRMQSPKRQLGRFDSEVCYGRQLELYSDASSVAVQLSRHL
jgi:hypothetical protein